jgi:hypothetical protein
LAYSPEGTCGHNLSNGVLKRYQGENYILHAQRYVDFTLALV